MMQTKISDCAQKGKKKRSRFSVFALIAMSMALVLALSACAPNKNAGNAGSQNAAGSTAKESQTIEAGGSLVIPASEISETTTFYPVTVEDVKMEVLAVKAPDGTIRTAFNTCQVCNGSPKAYFEQKGDILQCQNCGNEFSMDRVEIESGGCNPVPIFDENKTVTDESITVAYETLETNAYRFPANWKAA